MLKRLYSYIKGLLKNFSISLFVYVNVILIGSLFLLRLLYDNIHHILWIILVSILVCFALILLIVVLKPIKNTRNKNVGFFDEFVLSSLPALIIMTLFSHPFFGLIIKTQNNFAIFIVFASISSALFLYLIVRAFFLAGIANDEQSYIHLKDVLDGQLPEDRSLCLLKDEPVNYDLLGRKYILNRMSSAIDALLDSDGGALGLAGEWGSGKTTLLGNVIKNYRGKDVLICETIYPWQFNDESALFVAIISEIYKTINISADIKLIQKTFAKYANKFLSNEKVSFISDFLDLDTFDNDLIINIISDYLSKNKKKIILVLDDLDRSTDDIVLFVYKVIGSILKIKNVVFICLFGKERVEIALNAHHLEYDFLEKIFSVIIHVSISV